MEMIWESSYGSVSVDDICTKAGVNKGSFYYAFKSKSDLAVAAFERYWENKQPRLDKIFSPQVPPLERLDNYCQQIIKDQKEKYESFGKMLDGFACGSPPKPGPQNGRQFSAPITGPTTLKETT